MSKRSTKEKAPGGLGLPNLKTLLFSSKKGKQKKGDNEPDASEGYEEEAVHGGGWSQPATETMWTGRYNPYVYGYYGDTAEHYDEAMRQDQTDNLSIIYGFNGQNFQRQYVNPKLEQRCFSDAHEFRMKFYIGDKGPTDGLFNVEQYWKRRKYLQKNPWLQQWLIREVQTLSQDEDVEVIVHHIIGVAEIFFKRQQNGENKATPEQQRIQFRTLLSDAARPFLAGYTERFINELESFLVSGLNVEAYDKVCMQQISEPSSSGSLDSSSPCDETLRHVYLPYFDEDIEIDK
ncbi:hypothetical protein ZIOFF_056349 [Zingiber officinale]|uniref:Uncharacterized protein n=1 Tax=Zingiber officinale TaxID=94328 RepID=A0A8J5FM17_ZINOF|nr:hypothetical protein ZIOFF_056349 [Zingiber officinale]